MNNIRNNRNVNDNVKNVGIHMKIYLKWCKEKMMEFINKNDKHFDLQRIFNNNISSFQLKSYNDDTKKIIFN